MADVIAASDSHARDDMGVPAGRKRFEAPAVDDLGKLQELTQIQGVTITP